MDTQVQDIRVKSLPILERRRNINFAGIFGSRARGESKPDSDVDLLVEFKEPISLLTIIALERELTDTLNMNVDIVTKKSLHPYIAQGILKDLKMIYEGR